MQRMNIDTAKIKTLIALLDEAQLSEIEVRHGEQSIRIARELLRSAAGANTPPAETSRHTPTAAQVEPAGHTVKAPMVGIYYATPSPDAKPFVQVGDHVKKGQVLCILEAMKMMNQIEADKTGVIKACLVENGHPVEFGQALFVIE